MAVSPEKLLKAFAAHRKLRADTMVSPTLRAAQAFLDDVEVAYALSGSSAAVHYLGGRNSVSDLGRRIICTTRTLSQVKFPEGTRSSSWPKVHWPHARGSPAMPASRKPTPTGGQAQDGNKQTSPARSRRRCSPPPIGSYAPVPNLYEDQHGIIRTLVDRLGHDLEPPILIGGWATFVRVGGEISLDIDLPYESQLGGKLRLKVEVLAEYPDEL